MGRKTLFCELMRPKFAILGLIGNCFCNDLPYLLLSLCTSLVKDQMTDKGEEGRYFNTSERSVTAII